MYLLLKYFFISLIMNFQEKSISSFIIFVLILLPSYFVFFTIEPWQVAFTKTFWEINRDLKYQGLYFKLPFVTQVVKVNTRNIILTTTETAASKDAQDVTTEIAVNFSILPASAISLYETVWNESIITEQIVKKAIQESIKSSTSMFTATENITKRQEVREAMLLALESKLSSRWLVINQVDILNFSFSDQFNQAIETKVTAEQQALTEKANLEKVKYQAQQVIERAKAEAEKIRIQAEAITKQGWKEYVQLQWIEAWKSWKAPVPQTLIGSDNPFILNLK